MKYDFEKERPQVLLLGNGINLLNRSKDSFRWLNLIKCLSGNPDIDEISQCEDIPYTIFATACCDKEDEGRSEKIRNVFSSYEYPDNRTLQDLLTIPFEAILTTNYTYELENELNSKYLTLKNKSLWVETNNYDSNKRKKKEGKYLIKTYNHIPIVGGYRDVWHIHGELRNPSSVILTHDEYGKLMEKIISYLKGKNTYQQYYHDFEIRSWIDYLLMGDVYIVGLGFDFSEFDLWWLLSRRCREKAETGKIIYYEPYSDQNYSKQLMLKQLNVEVRNLNSYLFKKKKFDYPHFYMEVLADIRNEMEGKLTNHANIEM